ncbi:MAG: hypothetical protein ACPG57_03635, partial [Porticoccaceae bacterium]
FDFESVLLQRIKNYSRLFPLRKYFQKSYFEFWRARETPFATLYAILKKLSTYINKLLQSFANHSLLTGY